jgi:hypothetical protein
VKKLAYSLNPRKWATSYICKVRRSHESHSNSAFCDLTSCRHQGWKRFSEQADGLDKN